MVRINKSHGLISFGPTWISFGPFEPIGPDVEPIETAALGGQLLREHRPMEPLAQLSSWPLRGLQRLQWEKWAKTKKGRVEN